MIYIKAFKNYEEFKELFGVQEHGNGEKSRRNKILLSVFKSREILHGAACVKGCCVDYDCRNKRTGMPTHKWVYSDATFMFDIIAQRTMTDLFSNIIENLSYSSRRAYRSHRISIPFIDGIFSSKFRSDDFRGICEDGDVRSVRYVNTENERVFKMRAGKFLRKLIEENPCVDSILPEQVKIWVCEEFAEKWKAHAMQSVMSDDYTLHVNDDFCRIYDSDECKGDFGSCMTDKDYWTFYRDSVSAKAAYLENEDGKIVARCVIYTDVIDGNGKHLRLAERQYSSDCDESLKRLLIIHLINAGEIDGYKCVGADCHSPQAFVDVHGNTLESLDLKIRCNLEDYNTVSYQDSFKDYEDGWAYNSDDNDNLSITDGMFEGNMRWSEFNSEYIPEDEAYWVDSRNDYFWGSQVVRAHIDGCGSLYENYYEEDCVEIDGEYYYAGDNAEDFESYGISCCSECENYYFSDDAVYSEVTDDYYCCSSCMEEAERRYKEDNWYYSEYDDDYFKDEDDIVVIMQWIDYAPWRSRCNIYERTTISKDSLQDLIDEGEVIFFNGEYYLDERSFDGEPAHVAAVDFRAA